MMCPAGWQLGLIPVFETLPYASLVPVMQSCQQERDPGRVQEVSAAGAPGGAGRCPGRGEAGGARSALEEVGPWWLGPTQVFLEL